MEQKQKTKQKTTRIKVRMSGGHFVLKTENGKKRKRKTEKRVVSLNLENRIKVSLRFYILWLLNQTSGPGIVR